MSHTGHLWLTAFSLIPVWASCSAQPAPPPPEYREFAGPERVIIAGYSGDAMEPFLTPDGRYLLFNNLNDPKVNTDLHYAERIDDLHFGYRGPIEGVNTPALEGVPSVSCDGVLYFVSPRSYEKTFSTIYRARFDNGHAHDAELVSGISRGIPGFVNFDAEISADGQTLIAVDGHFGRQGSPDRAILFEAKASGLSASTLFVRSPDSDAIFRLVNKAASDGALQYAPSLSSDGLELFFTRVGPIRPGVEPHIWRAVRSTAQDPFGEPALIPAIDGFAEGPTLSPDGLSLYYHKRQNGTFSIFRVTRRPSSEVHSHSCRPN